MPPGETIKVQAGAADVAGPDRWLAAPAAREARVAGRLRLLAEMPTRADGRGRGGPVGLASHAEAGA